jgi:hypothetical protein
MEEKIKLIRQITSRHPSYGVKRGWSEYTGGMKDSGHWFHNRMYDVSNEELQAALDHIIIQENIPARALTEQELIKSKIFVKLPNGGFTNQLMLEEEIEFLRDLEYKMLFGK